MSSHVLAAGGVVLRAGAHQNEVIIVHRPKYDDWSFPKGKVDPGEALEETALREVLEETALQCRLRSRLSTKEYPRKTVHYWLMEVQDEAQFVPNQEIDELRWVSVSEAGGLLTHRQDQELLDEVHAQMATGRQRR